MKLILNSDLPLPPTINQYYRAKVVKGRPVIYKNDGGYFKQVTYELFQFANKVPTDKPLLVEIMFHFASRRKQDIDNRLKALLDSLNGLVWADDSQIIDLRVRIGEPVKGGLVNIQVYELKEKS